MPFTPKPITPAQLTTAAVAYYTAPTNVKVSRVLLVVATNTTATNRTITVHIVPSGGTASATNMVLDGVIVPAHTALPLYEVLNQFVPPGGTLQALSDAGTAVSISGSLLDIT